MRKLRKGTTVVEVVIAFAMISMSFAIGMIGIASGSNFLNSGAKLKNQQRKMPLWIWRELLRKLLILRLQ